MTELGRRLLPYIGTKGNLDVTYCQLDHVELYDSYELRNHANKLILTLQKENDTLEALLIEACEIHKRSVNLEASSECDAEEFLNKPEIKKLLGGIKS